MSRLVCQADAVHAAPQQTVFKLLQGRARYHPHHTGAEDPFRKRTAMLLILKCAGGACLEMAVDSGHASGGGPPCVAGQMAASS
jgi:hypothetical protein